MNLLNSTINIVFETVWYPFALHPPVWGVLFLSVATGGIAAVTYRYLADQEGLKRAGDLVKAAILEMRLFDYSPALILAALVRSFGYVFLYIVKSLRPLIVLMIPVIVTLVQLHFVYDYAPLGEGEEAVLTVTAAGGMLDIIIIEPSDNISFASPPVRVPATGQIHRAIRMGSNSNGNITVRADNFSYTFPVIAGEHRRKVYPVAVAGGFADRLAHFGGRYIPKNDYIEKIELDYGDRRESFFGFMVHWLIAFFVLSFIAGAAIMKVFGIHW